MRTTELTILITIAIAVFVLIKLRSVLGKRTGHQNPSNSQYVNMAGKNKSMPDSAIDSPDNDNKTDKEKQQQVYNEIDTLYKKGSNLNNKIRKLKEVDEEFSPKEFLNGAKIAYEMILVAFHEPDTDTLKNLLSKDVYTDFANIIKQRKKDNHVVNFSFIGIDKAEITDVNPTKKENSIKVSFVSQIVSATYDKNDNLIEGNAKEIVEVVDLWTFSRSAKSRSPNWKLVATESR